MENVAPSFYIYVNIGGILHDYKSIVHSKCLKAIFSNLQSDYTVQFLRIQGALFSHG